LWYVHGPRTTGSTILKVGIQILCTDEHPENVQFQLAAGVGHAAEAVLQAKFTLLPAYDFSMSSQYFFLCEPGPIRIHTQPSPAPLTIRLQQAPGADSSDSSAGEYAWGPDLLPHVLPGQILTGVPPGPPGDLAGAHETHHVLTVKLLCCVVTIIYMHVIPCVCHA
jgi:hypothetical protein